MILTLTRVFPKMCSPVFSCSFDRCKGFCMVDCMVHNDWLRQGVNRAAKQGSAVELSKWQTGYRVIEEVYVLACMWWAWGEKKGRGGRNTSLVFILVLLFHRMTATVWEETYNLDNLVQSSFHEQNKRKFVRKYGTFRI